MKPSAAAILTLLRDHPEGITAMTALQEARCLRLAARISDLKAEGYKITADIIPVSHGKHVALYRLREKPHALTLEEVGEQMRLELGNAERHRIFREDVLEANRWTPEELVTVASQSGMEISRG